MNECQRRLGNEGRWIVEISREEYLRLKMAAYSAKQDVADLERQVEWLKRDVEFWKKMEAISLRHARRWEEFYNRLADEREGV